MSKNPQYSGFFYMSLSFVFITLKVTVKIGVCDIIFVVVLSLVYRLNL